MPSIFPSISVFSNELALHIRWPKYWSFSFSISPSNAYSQLIFFRISWFDLLAVQGTLKSLLQHHSLEASILQCSVFFFYPEKMIIPKDTCTPMFTAALFTTARTWKQPKRPSTERIKKMWSIYTMEYYSIIKKNEIMPFTATWMDVESVKLNEVR